MISGDALERLLMSTHSAPLQTEDAGWLNQDNVRAFFQIYQRRSLSAVFQPILDFRGHGYLGFEGLIRGPAQTPLHSPHVLFGLARETGLTTEFERLCREIVLHEFARQKLPGRLFLNVSVSCLADPAFNDGSTRRLLDRLGLSTPQVVLELTENQHVSDFAALREVLTAFRRDGYQFAIDDLGEGFSNLRIWSEIRAEFVKIDRHFISGIADDALKFQLVKAMHEISDTCHVNLIAEGIETEAEFATVRDLGINYGQGFLVAYPEQLPRTEPEPAVRALLKRSSVIMYPRSTHQAGGATARKLMQLVDPVHPYEENEDVFARFERDGALMVLPVVTPDGKPLGLINRYSLIDRFAQPFRRELYGKKPCTTFMNAQPIIVDRDTSVQEIGRLLGQSAQHHLLDGFIVTAEGRYAGVGSSQALMSMITDMQIRAARYANPLTQLPGNVPINEHIDRLINSGVAFAAAYCDLDHFKPYNDVYGYRRGDELIQWTGALLQECFAEATDFLGHVGGDDFILALSQEDWEPRVQVFLERFEAGRHAFFAPQDDARGGYFSEDRQGRTVFHPLASVSVGIVEVQPGAFQNHHEVASAASSAKKLAKQQPGCSCFLDRRRSRSKAEPPQSIIQGWKGLSGTDEQALGGSGIPGEQCADPSFF